MTRAIRWLAIMALATVAVTGCEKGPAEKVGEKIDEAVDELAGKKGPAEEAGEKIDEAAEDLEEAGEKLKGE